GARLRRARRHRARARQARRRSDAGAAAPRSGGADARAVAADVARDRVVHCRQRATSSARPSSTRRGPCYGRRVRRLAFAILALAACATPRSAGPTETLAAFEAALAAGRMDEAYALMSS